MHVLLGITCFVISVLFAVLVVFLTWSLFSRFGTVRVKQIQEGNIAAALLLGSELLAFGILMKSCLYPVSAVLQDLFVGTGSDAGVLKTLGYASGFFVVGYALSVLTIFIAAQFFQLLTRQLNERAEIASGNIAVAIVFALVIIAIAVMAQSGLSDLLNTLIPMPASSSVAVSI